MRDDQILDYSLGFGRPSDSFPDACCWWKCLGMQHLAPSIPASLIEAPGLCYAGLLFITYFPIGISNQRMKLQITTYKCLNLLTAPDLHSMSFIGTHNLRILLNKISFQKLRDHYSAPLEFLLSLTVHWTVHCALFSSGSLPHFRQDPIMEPGSFP